METKKYFYVEAGEYSGLVGELIGVDNSSALPDYLLKSPVLLARNDSDEYWVYAKYVHPLTDHETQQYIQEQQ